MTRPTIALRLDKSVASYHVPAMMPKRTPSLQIAPGAAAQWPAASLPESAARG
jgi:hypothetical protein